MLQSLLSTHHNLTMTVSRTIIPYQTHNQSHTLYYHMIWIVYYPLFIVNYIISYIIAYMTKYILLRVYFSNYFRECINIWVQVITPIVIIQFLTLLYNFLHYCLHITLLPTHHNRTMTGSHTIVQYTSHNHYTALYYTII